MKQLKYAIQNVIRGKGSNIVKVVSITLGLLVSVILIAKVAYEFILLLLRLPGTFPLKWKVLRQ